MVRALADAGARAGFDPHVGLIQTEDAFYGTTPDDVPRLQQRGVLAIEMEAAALFTLGALRGVETGCALVASNRIGDESFVDPEVLAKSVRRMTEMTLEAMLELDRAERGPE